MVIKTKLNNIRNDLSEFFINNNISNLALGVIIGTSGAVAIKSLMDNIILPIIFKLQNTTNDDWNNSKTLIFGVNLKIKKFLFDTSTFVITIFMSFIFIQYFTKPLFTIKGVKS